MRKFLLNIKRNGRNVPPQRVRTGIMIKLGMLASPATTPFIQDQQGSQTPREMWPLEILGYPSLFRLTYYTDTTGSNSDLNNSAKEINRNKRKTTLVYKEEKENFTWPEHALKFGQTTPQLSNENQKKVPIHCAPQGPTPLKNPSTQSASCKGQPARSWQTNLTWTKYPRPSQRRDFLNRFLAPKAVKPHETNI